MPRRWVWSFLLVLAFSAMCFGRQPVVKDAVEVSTPYGPFSLKNVSVSSDGVVSATIANNTNRSWRYAQFLVYLKDKKGKYLTLQYGTQNYSLVAGARNLSPGQTGQLESSPAPNYLPIPGKFVDFDIQFNPTNSEFIFNYVFNLITPRENSSPAFADETISIAFSPTNQQIAFLLVNQSSSPIRLDWDQMAYVDFDGSSHRVIHQGVRLIQKDAPQAPTTVPPGSSVQDFLYPSDRVSWNSTIGDWMELPIWSSIPSPGQRFGVFLPIDVNGKTKNYLFTIKVADVRY